MKPHFNEVCQFKISLKEIRPEIWRRIQVPGNYAFWDLHVAIQDAMGWLDYHLHVFRVSKPGENKIVEIGMPDEYNPEILHGWKVPVSDYFSHENNHAEYEYDFGDCWQHDVVLEQILPRNDGKYPRCIAGERACPPEDCGGVSGYQEFLEAILDPNHEEHERLLEWAGGSFDPQAFDPEQVEFDDPDERWELAFTEG